MKGTPYEPQCGFSAKTVQILIECESQFSYVDVLANNEVRVALPKVSDWPTFPQVFINGELIGRGAADMKGSVAVFIESVKNFLKDHPKPNFQIWIMLTSNEEGEPVDGKIDTLMKSLTAQNKFIDYCLVGEASSSESVGDVLRIGMRGSVSGNLK